MSLIEHKKLEKVHWVSTKNCVNKKAAKQRVQYSNIQKLFKNGQNSKICLKNNTVVYKVPICNSKIFAEIAKFVLF